MKKLIHLSIAAQVFLHTAPCASSQKRLAAFRSRTRPYVAPSGDRYRPLSAGRTEFCQAAAMKKVTSFIILIFLYLSTFAQEVDLPQVFSPNAAEIGRYGKVPASPDRNTVDSIEDQRGRLAAEDELSGRRT